MLALVVASRFGMLLGLALWLGVGVAFLLALGLLERNPALAREQAGALARALAARLDRLLLAAAGLVVVGLVARVLIDRAAPPTSLVLPVAVMLVARLLSLVPGLGRLRGLLLTCEVCLALYALYAVS